MIIRNFKKLILEINYKADFIDYKINYQQKFNYV
jgi:hypothetical protein